MSEIDLARLKEPFAAEDIEWRVQSSGNKNGKPWAMVLAYVTARAIQDRLDNVCGPGNWRNQFEKGPDGGVMCGLSIRINGEWVTKWDGAENTQVEAVKGGYSASTKRTAVQWGIGRYLYNLDAGWANFEQNGKHSAKIDMGNGKKEYHKWNPPPLPAWALPAWALPATSKQNDKPKAVQENKPVEQEKPPEDERKIVEQWLDWIDAHTHQTAAELKAGWKKHLLPNLDKFPADHQNELNIAYKDTLTLLKEKDNA